MDFQPRRTPLGRCRLAAVFVLLGVLQLGTSTQAAAQLSESDRAELTQALEVLSAAWDGEAASEANEYLGRADVSAEEWDAYFTDFLDTHPFTQPLGTYLSYPTFHWFGNETKAKLQIATSAALQTALDDLVDAAGGYEGTLLASDSLVENVVSMHQYMNRMVNLAVSDEAEGSTFRYYKEHIAGNGDVLRKTHTIDTSTHPDLGAVRAQIYMNVRDAVWNDASRKEDVVSTLGLNAPSLARYLTVWQDHTVLVIDNNQADERQVEVIGDLLALVPSELHDLGTIRMRDFLGAGAQGFTFKQNHGVNVFTYPVGSRSENGFPHDIDPLYVDVFTTVLAHEVNHVVNAYYIGLDEARDARHDELIEEAGSYRYNYLRSHVGDGFFQQAPQEFFASISNQYFASSWHTLDLAVSRLRRGYPDPLSQFLFFADIYSLGTDSSYFYRFDLQGNIERETVPLRRDETGRITELQAAEGEAYVFTWNEEGRVSRVDEAESLTARAADELPQRIELGQNFPNPFNPRTVIPYRLSEAAPVRLEVMDPLGRRISVPVHHRMQSPGSYRVSFDATDLASGTYFYRLVVGGKSITRMMQLIK